MSSKQLSYRLLVWLVVVVLLATVSGCGTDNTPTTLPGGGQGAPGGGQGALVATTPPAPTNTPLPTNTPVPTPTATEIPLILPTPTAVLPPPPLGTGGLLPPTIPAAPTATASPTVTPTPTITPTAVPVPPTATPLPPLALNITANYSPLLNGYSILSYYPPPELTTQCIDETYLKRDVSRPTPTSAGTPGTAPTIPPTPTIVNGYGVAPPDYWITLFKSRYVFPPSGPPTGPNSTPGPVNASTPVNGPLPPSNPGFSATATPNPPQRYVAGGNDFTLGSNVLTDTIAALTDITYYKPELMVMWNVMNNLTRQLIDPQIDPKAYQQTYEAALNQLVNSVLRVNSISRIIIGNVPDIAAMRYYTTCFSETQLRQVQRDYNAMFESIRQRYPGRVYIARLDLIDIRNHPQWVYINDGVSFTLSGAAEVAVAFGREFSKIRYR